MVSYNFNNKELNRLILQRKGGKTSVRIIDKLLIKPYNINQLSKVLGLDYKTIKHHITLIHEAEFIIQEENSYGSLYYPSKKLLKNLNEYEKIKKIIEK